MKGNRPNLVLADQIDNEGSHRGLQHTSSSKRGWSHDSPLIKQGHIFTANPKVTKLMQENDSLDAMATMDINAIQKQASEIKKQSNLANKEKDI